MNLSLVWMWKEWRAQRALLGAWVVLTLASTALVTALLPAYYWKQEDAGTQVLSWFVAVSVLGVVGFAAPQLVRAEFAQKDDQFVRRLPGALRPSFGGKLLFLVLATLLVPLLGLLVGEWFVTAIGRDWNGLFDVRHYDLEVVMRWPQAGVLAAAALLLGPWVWAVGTWMPGGRMAVGGAGLLLLVLGFGVAGVLRACPGLEKTITWLPWLLALSPAGVALAAVSWVRGRRGGGALRSARVGLATLSVLLLPPATALGAAAWRYHHPDPLALQNLVPQGTTPDGRWLLVRGAGHPEWVGPPFRIDLETGATEQLGSVHDYWRPAGMHGIWQPTPARWWCGEASVLDLATGAVRLPSDEDDLRRTLAEAARAGAPFRTPTGQRAWVFGGALHVERPDGEVARIGLPRQDYFGRACGHGWGFPRHWFDLGRLRSLGHLQRGDQEAMLLRDQWFVRERGKGRPNGAWFRQDFDDGTRTEVEGLRGASCLGLLDDDHLLFLLGPSGVRPLRLVACARDGRLRRVEHDLDPDREPIASVRDMAHDPQGRPWLMVGRDVRRSGSRDLLLRVDPSALRVERMPVAPGTLVRVLDDAAITVEDGERVVRTELPSGERTVVYPPR
ncbi:MAG: hypothetical protein AB7O97_19175 [Planctomycetota bacterium]